MSCLIKVHACIFCAYRVAHQIIISQESASSSRCFSCLSNEAYEVFVSNIAYYSVYSYSWQSYVSFLYFYNVIHNRVNFLKTYIIYLLKKASCHHHAFCSSVRVYETWDLLFLPWKDHVLLFFFLVKWESFSV